MSALGGGTFADLKDEDAAASAVATAVARLERERRAGWPSEAEQAASVAASSVPATARLWSIVDCCGERDWGCDEPAGGPEGLARLLRTGLADVNGRRAGETPLLRAVRTHVDMRVGEAAEKEPHAGAASSLAAIRLLLEHGADVRARRGGGDDPGGANALETASACPDAAELAELLRQY